MATHDHYDVLAERSKALRSGRSLARGVGSNPTDVIFDFFFQFDILSRSRYSSVGSNPTDVIFGAARL